MKRIASLLALLLLANAAGAHHSFAIYDFETMIPFEGTVETLNFKNPHIEMTLRITDENGVEKIIDFVEGAPANMLVRQGLKPDMVKVGTHIEAVGSPLIDEADKYFLRIIRLEDGKEYQ